MIELKADDHHSPSKMVLIETPTKMVLIEDRMQVFISSSKLS
jgi:hypothetical protein